MKYTMFFFYMSDISFSIITLPFLIMSCPDSPDCHWGHLPTESESPWLMPVTPLPIQTIAMRLPSLCVPTSHLWGHGLSLPWHPCCQE